MTRVPDDKEIGRVCREDLLQLVKKLAAERDEYANELLALEANRCPACAAMHTATCDCPTCAVGAGPW
jgi:hypothetical protein